MALYKAAMTIKSMNDVSICLFDFMYLCVLAKIVNYDFRKSVPAHKQLRAHRPEIGLLFPQR